MRISDWSSDVCSSDLAALTSLLQLNARCERQSADEFKTSSHPKRPWRSAPSLTSRLTTARKGSGKDLLDSRGSSVPSSIAIRATIRQTAISTLQRILQLVHYLYSHSYLKLFHVQLTN